MMKPNFKEMSLKQLRKYVLAHRDDEEAWREYADRPRKSVEFPPSSNFSEHKEIIDRLTQKKIE